MTFVLLVDHESDYDSSGVHGPFDTLEEAQAYAERLRTLLDLPAEATPENNDIWTGLGWYFGIVQPVKEV